MQITLRGKITEDLVAFAKVCAKAEADLEEIS